MRVGLAIAFALGAVTVIAAQGIRSSPSGDLAEDLSGSAVLATVDGHPITVEEFEREVKRRGGVTSFRQIEHRRALLDDMIEEAVLIANARRAGYDRDPDVRREMGRILSGRYRQERIDAELNEVKVTERELRDFYEANPRPFTTPEAAHAALIFFAIQSTDSPERRQKMTELANEVRAAAEKQNATSHFGALAVQNSHDQASRYRGGDIGWVARGQKDSRWEPAVLDAIFALVEPGALTPVIAGERGLYVIRLLERRAATARPLDEVAGTIRQQLRAEKRRRRSEELYAAAAARLQIEVNEQRLTDLDFPRAEMAERRNVPPPVPNG